MALPVLLFVAAMAVRTDRTPLRSGCDTDDGIVASLPAGTPVEVRFRLADGSDCFKVAATIDGKDVLGYVPASALTGLERYERERSSAASVSPTTKGGHAALPFDRRASTGQPDRMNPVSVADRRPRRPEAVLRHGARIRGAPGRQAGRRHR